MSIKDNKKHSAAPNDFNPLYSDATQAANVTPQNVYGYKDQYINDIITQFGLPEEGIFNPYDYISHKNYKMNRRGQASYEEDLARLTYLADLRQQEFQNQYNSPENQANLLREAGINPDLQGVSSSGSAAGPTPTGSAMANQPTNMQQATNVLGIISNVASLTTGMLQGGLGISNAFKQAASNDISLMGNAIDFMSKYYVNGIDAHKLPLPRRVMRQLSQLNGTDGVNWFRMLNAKRDATENKIWSDYYESNFLRFSKQFNKYYNSANNFDLEKWSEVWSPLTKFAEDALLGNAKLDKSKRNNEQAYQDATSADGKSVGAMKGAMDVESYNQSSFNASIRTPLREVVQNLKERSQDGSSWANFALIALYLVTNLYGLK